MQKSPTNLSPPELGDLAGDIKVTYLNKMLVRPNSCNQSAKLGTKTAATF